MRELRKQKITEVQVIWQYYKDNYHLRTGKIWKLHIKNKYFISLRTMHHYLSIPTTPEERNKTAKELNLINEKTLFGY